MAPSMPGKTARALCPVCQEPMPPDETECDNCGAFVIDEAVVRLSRAFGIPREKALALFEKGFRHPKQIGDRDVDDVLENGENGLLFLCTNCGGFVATGDMTCPRCAAEFEAEEPASPKNERDILDLVLCPVCGADNEPTWKECEICGEPLGGTEEPPGTIAVEPVAPSTGAILPETGRDEELVPASDASGSDVADDLPSVDEILRNLDLPAKSTTATKVRRVQRVAKVAKTAMSVSPAAPPGEIHPTERTTGQDAIDPDPTASPRPRPVTRPRAVRPHRPVARSTDPLRPRPRMATFVSTRARPHRWTVPPPELTSGLVLAAAAGLYASTALGQTTVEWIVAGVVLLLTLIVLGIALAGRDASLRRLDVELLSAAALLGSLAVTLPISLAPAASVAGALLLALETRRLLASRARDFVVAASGVSLVVFGLVAAEGLEFASSPSWVFGLLAAVPWPAAVALEGVRLRRATAAAHREILKAERDLARRDYAESVKDFDRAIALGAKGTPGEELPWYGKGASLILLGRYEEALRAIDKALDLNPYNEVAWLNKGNALTKMGRLVDALRCFNAAIKVNPAYEVAWNNKGNTLARLGHFEEALTCYERALEIDPDYRGAWVNKGYVLTKLGRYNEATSCADRVLRLADGAQMRIA